MTAGYLIDTNVISELRKGVRSDPSLANWFEDNKHAELWLSVVTVGEIRRGIQRVARRDPSQAELLTDWLSELINIYDDRILPITLAVATRWGTLGVPDPVPVLDGLIAATALEADLTIVSRNVSDFERCHVEILNPFETLA